jgi:hypothetical protein
MSGNLGLRPKPEEEELKLKKEELQLLENQLIDLELQLTSLRGELAAFERLYLKTVGVRYAELDEIEAQIAEFVVRRDPANPKAQSTAREARARAEESRTGTAELAAKETIRFSPSSSLKSLYREVARRIHPDLAVDALRANIRETVLVLLINEQGEKEKGRDEREFSWCCSFPRGFGWRGTERRQAKRAAAQCSGSQSRRPRGAGLAA